MQEWEEIVYEFRIAVVDRSLVAVIADYFWFDIYFGVGVFQTHKLMMWGGEEQPAA
jgi:hypothetical protein